MEKDNKTITKLALCSRLVIILLQYISNIIIPDHDAGVFLYPRRSNINCTVADKLINHFIEGFVRWDAQYFMHIATHGYTYENTLAFFPLYPLIVKVLALTVHTIFPILCLDTILLIIFTGLNIVLFVASAKVIHKLTLMLFDEELAYNATVLFCINPASIFFSAPYTECMFFYLTLLSIMNCVILYTKYSSAKCKIDYCDFLYIAPISLSILVRSNGVLNIGFLAYTYTCLSLKKWPKGSFLIKVGYVVHKILMICFLAAVCLVPFAFYQIYCYRKFCTNFNVELPVEILNYAKEEGFILPGQFHKYNQTWCYKNIPLAYSYVQEHYWNVGFLRYYEFKQLPNFLLAAPILSMVIVKCVQHMLNNTTMNILDVFTFHLITTKKKPLNMTHNPLLNVFVIHILFLSVFCIFFVHIQVSTRMLCSASPVFYWFCADYFKGKRIEVNVTKYVLQFRVSAEHTIVMYFLTYLVIGTVLFCNFLPWT